MGWGEYNDMNSKVTFTGINAMLGNIGDEPYMDLLNKYSGDHWNRYYLFIYIFVTLVFFVKTLAHLCKI